MAALKKVIIEVGGKKMEFTPEEAKELKAILSDLFGGERVVVERIREYGYPWRYWQPYISGTSTWSDSDGQPRYVAGQIWSVSEPTSGYISISSVSQN